LRSPQTLPFPSLSSPSSPSLSSQQRGSSPQVIAGASSGPAPTAPALSCAEDSRAGRRTPGGRLLDKQASTCHEIIICIMTLYFVVMEAVAGIFLILM